MPRVITFQRKRANRRVINEDRLIDMLREFGEVSMIATPVLQKLFDCIGQLRMVLAGSGYFCRVGELQPEHVQGWQAEVVLKLVWSSSN